MKLVAGLGNPGPKYDATRHNLGWWVVDRLAFDWDFGAFELRGPALVSQGEVQDVSVVLVKPTTYMNRSGAALRSFRSEEDFCVSDDLLVVVDDAALEVGRVRFRRSGSAGSHNGLASVVAALGTEDFPRLRVGVGLPPDPARMKQWVLSEMDGEDEDAILTLLPELTRGVEVWVSSGIEAAMNQFNR